MRVCSHFQVTEKDICSKRRDQGVLKARQATIYLFREITMMSLSEMGRFFGRTHSTIHSSLKKVYQRMKSDEFFRRQLYQLRDELKENEEPSSQRNLQLNRGSWAFWLLWFISIKILRLLVNFSRRCPSSLQFHSRSGFCSCRWHVSSCFWRDAVSRRLLQGLSEILR